jgi:hypothetical protein
MSFNITSFSELLRDNKYSSWSDFSTFLQSNEGGSLRIVNIDNSPFAIIRYVKGKSDFTLQHVRDSRSVVWNTETNSPICFAPVKAEKVNIPQNTSTYISDFVDGTMINVFNYNGNIHIATRSSLGANSSFYDFYSTKPKTFSGMFDEVFSPLGGYKTFLSSVLAHGEFASFVLQHPENRVVAPIPNPRTFVVSFGRVNTDSSVSMFFNPSSWPTSLQSYAPFSYSTEPDVKELSRRKGFAWQGIVLQDISSGRRWRIRNSAYILARNLRGSESSGFERFLRLRSSGTLKTYLTYFNDESNLMWSFEQLFRERTQALYSAYVDMNKLKKIGMKDIDFPLRTHVYALHGKYLQNIKDGKPSSITLESVIQYVNSLPSEEQVKIVGNALRDDKYKLSFTPKSNKGDDRKAILPTPSPLIH